MYYSPSIENSRLDMVSRFYSISLFVRSIVQLRTGYHTCNNESPAETTQINTLTT